MSWVRCPREEEHEPHWHTIYLDKTKAHAAASGPCDGQGLYRTHARACAVNLPDHEGDAVEVEVTVEATGATGWVPLCEKHRGAR